MVRFTLFGVPVTIQPWFWLTIAFLGGMNNVRTSEGLLALAIFMMVATVSILIHEFGHALVGRRLGSGYATVELWGLGGLAYNHGGRFTRWQRFAMVAAGPGAGFAFGFLVLAVLGFAFGDRDTLILFKETVFDSDGENISNKTLMFLMNKPFLFKMITDLLWVNFWWGFINLLPVLPLDGGRIMELFVKPQKRVYQISIAAAALTVIYALKHEYIYMAILFGAYGYQSYTAMKQSRWS